MARLPRQHDAIYEAAATWKRDCLLADGSVFHAGDLWTIPHIEELIRDFVERPDVGARTFEEKLNDQLARSSAEAKQLAAEMLWAMMLFPSNLRLGTKVELIQTVWSWSGKSLHDSAHMLDALEGGVGSGGMG